MKITRSADWRDALAFDVPVRADGVLPGDDARCAMCGPTSAPRPRAELWVVKQRHPHDPAGTVRLFCDEHRPEVTRPVAAAVAGPGAGRARSRAGSGAGRLRTAAARTPARPERVAAVCPDCFVEVPATGVCGMCGRRVA